MYLLLAPKSKTMGYQEPRFYLDVEENSNYSTYNNNGSSSPYYIKTNFSKVRIVSIRNKRGEMVDKIDISDFTFAKSNGNFCIEKLNSNDIFIDAAPYASAFNNSLQHYSQLKVDLRITPFHLKFEEWGKFGDLSNCVPQEDTRKQTAWIAGNGVSGGATPKVKIDEILDIKPYLPTSARHMWG